MTAQLTALITVAVCLCVFTIKTETARYDYELSKRYIGTQNFLPVLDRFMNKQIGYDKKLIISGYNKKSKLPNMKKMWKWWIKFIQLNYN